MTLRILQLVAVALCARGQSPDAVVRMREAALSYGDRLQNFTCTEILARAIGPSPDGMKWKPLETQEWEVNYVDHREHRTLLRVNGDEIEPEKQMKHGYFQGYGQFGEALHKILDPKVKAQFEFDRQEGQTCAYRYRAAQANSTAGVHADRDDLQLGHHGTVWADCATGDVTRFYTETELGFVRRAGRRVQVGYRLEVRYGLVNIGEKEFLLPQTAVQNAVFYKTWTKAEIRFENYRKYDASSTVTFEKER